MRTILVAFVCLGFLIGNLVGFSSSSSLAILIPLLFTFAGGSAVGFVPKLESHHRNLAAGAVIALSLSCLAGVYWGILVAERQLLSPQSIQKRTPSQASVNYDRHYYLRTFEMRDIDAIDQKFRNSEINAQEAYEELYAVIQRGGRQ